MKVLFAGGGTGGHLYPGLAIARALVRCDSRVEPFFVGARRGIEREVLPGTEFPHELLDLHPLYRSKPWENWRTIAGAAGAWRRIGVVARGAELVVGTGGYAAGLALAHSVTAGRPFVLQEQNSHPGLTMRAFSRWAREIYIGFPEAARLMKRGARTEIIDSGNPIDPPPTPRPDRVEARRRWGFSGLDGHVLLIVGGSQGARPVNEVVARWIERGLPDGWNVIWATGRAGYDRFARLDQPRVRVRPYLSPIAEAYAACDLALARAGAMTTAELCAWGIPMVLVPLPTAAADHQTANARALESAGAALRLEQDSLSVDGLDAAVGRLRQDSARLTELARAASARGRPNAAETIARRILSLLDVNQIRS